MNLTDILAKCDHTLLTQTATCPAHAAALEAYGASGGAPLKAHIAAGSARVQNPAD